MTSLDLRSRPIFVGVVVVVGVGLALLLQSVAFRARNSALESPTPNPSAQLVTACGEVIGYASDGAHMLLTLSTGNTQTQYNLQYQFASSPPLSDIGTRCAEHTPQLIRVSGRQAAPDSGSPAAVSLREFTVTRLDSCL